MCSNDEELLSDENGADVAAPVDSRPSSSFLEENNLPVFGPQIKQGNTIGARMQALWMFSHGDTTEKITEQTAVSRSSIYRLKTKAISRGWDPNGVLEPYHVDDSPKSGRPKILTSITSSILTVMTKNSTTRGWLCFKIAKEVSSLLPEKQSVSASTVYRTLIAEGYRSYKKTVKPGLNEENKKLRLKWCLEHSIENGWDLERWKDVIWTDETSVQLSSVRGKRRIWRKENEVYHPHVIVHRWKGFKEFMW
jgi:transposase